MEIVLDDHRATNLANGFSPVALRVQLRGNPTKDEGRRGREPLTGDNKTIKTVVKKTPSAPAVGSCNKRARKTPRWMWRVIIPTKWTRPIPNLGESRQVLLHVLSVAVADATFFNPSGKHRRRETERRSKTKERKKGLRKHQIISSNRRAARGV